MKIKKIISELFSYLKQFFISGFIFILPIVITFAFFKFGFALIKGWLVPLRNLNIPIINQIPHHEIILVLLIIFFIGMLLKFFILRLLIKLMEYIFGKLPMIRTIYFGLKQLIHSFTSKDKLSFQKVVIVEFPLEGIYSYGFLTSDVLKEVLHNKNNEFVNIYIPKTPNIATGFFVMVEKSKIIETDLTRQEALSLIISCGIIMPERFEK